MEQQGGVKIAAHVGFQSMDISYTDSEGVNEGCTLMACVVLSKLKFSSCH